MPANDEPHGIFTLNPEQQSVVVVVSGTEVTRALVINVTRLAGTFGNASVGYRITGGINEVMDIQEMLGGRAEGRLILREGHTFSTITVPINREVRAAYSHVCRRVFTQHVLPVTLLSVCRCFCHWVQASNQSSLMLDLSVLSLALLLASFMKPALQ